MKKMILPMIAFLSSLQLFAGVSSSNVDLDLGSVSLPSPFYLGVVSLSADGNSPNPDCGSFTRMTLDTGALVGQFAYFEDLMTATSRCDLFISLNPRFVKISQTKDIGCGSLEYSGSWEAAGGDIINVVITDHRHRLCDDMDTLVQVEFTSASLSSSDLKILKSF